MFFLKKAVVTVLLFLPSFAVAQAPVQTTPAMEQRVEQMIGKMSVDDKLALIGGEDNFYTKAIPSIGLKRLKMSDASVGVRTFGQATAYTASVALAASWDPELAQRVGASLGEDARARGVNFLLAPGVNIYRSPLNGRNMEYLGEDPYLSGRIAAEFILGVQSKGVSATVKHFAANNSEFDRHRINAVVDERTLRELYLPAFEAAVKVGHVGAVMDSYNLINGEHATQNQHLNNEILKKEWGFQGVLMSDWNATYDGVAAANHGLDLEMPFAKLMTPETLKAALKDGKLEMSTLDDKVRRILRTAIQFGWLDRDQWDTSIPLSSLKSDHVALDEARASITLLKNEGNLLPLNAKKIKALAVVGPNAVNAAVGGGGSSHTTPFQADSFVTGFASYLGESVKVMYAPGLPDIQQLISHTKFTDMTLESRASSFDGKVLATRHVTGISGGNRDGGVEFTSQGKGTSYYHWKGKYVAQQSASYLLLANSNNSDGFRIAVNGEDALQRKAEQEYRNGHVRLEYGSVHLEAGVPTEVEVWYSTPANSPRLGVALVPEGEMLPAESRRIIQDADAVFIAAGFDATTESEGFDRTYTMPNAQNELIQQVALLNKNIIVDVTAGGAVETAPWIAKVPVLLHNYYPGQQGARAMAEIVFGERSPEGHLPFSWERVLADNPTSDHYAEEPGDGRVSHYAEGLNVGYRYYTTMQKQPLFPFGFGLTYTTFTYSHLMVKPLSADDVEVSFDVQNSGAKEGADVAQVYIGDPSSKVKRPAMELKQFAKIHLKPGAKQHVVLHLDRRAFEYYDVTAKNWTLDPGDFTVFLGNSSESIAAKSTFKMQ